MGDHMSESLSLFLLSFTVREELLKVPVILQVSLLFKPEYSS